MQPAKNYSKVGGEDSLNSEDKLSNSNYMASLNSDVQE
jgi:hypothetical protein